MKKDFNWISDIFSEVFDLEDYDLSLESEFESVPGWDSLGHMGLIAKLEEKLDTEFDLEEIIGVDTVQKILELANSKIA
tara:strand:+ start:520 stop:756 length:237 start_codon:yes stop_codon:yes gene_type:complete